MIPYLRDIQIAQPLRYPVLLKVTLDRERAGQLSVMTSSNWPLDGSGDFFQPLYG